LIRFALKFGQNHMITYSQISDFTYINQLPKMSKVWKERNIYDRFTLV